MTVGKFLQLSFCDSIWKKYMQLSFLGRKFLEHYSELPSIQIIGYIETQLTKMIKVPITQSQFDALFSLALFLSVDNLKLSPIIRKLNDMDLLELYLNGRKWMIQ